MHIRTLSNAASSADVTLETYPASLRGTVGRVTTLGWANDEVAQSYMHYVLQRIMPILLRHGWYVDEFREFYPRATTLLGLNVDSGKEVLVRFREPGKRDVFRPVNEVVGTAVHELAHCAVRTHCKKFWKLYDDLVRECEAIDVRLIDQGVSLYPRHPCCAPSQHGWERHRTTTSPPRPTVPVRTGRRLGGSRVRAPLTPDALRGVLAAAVAQRRASLTRNAPNLSDVVVHSSGSWDCPCCGFANAAASATCAVCAADSGEDAATAGVEHAGATRKRERNDVVAVGWHCVHCTFINSDGLDTCAMCGGTQTRHARTADTQRGMTAATPIDVSDEDSP